MSITRHLAFNSGLKEVFYHEGHELPPQILQAIQQERERIAPELEAPDSVQWKQAYTLPGSLDELRAKRSGFYTITGGTSVYGNGLSDYAHSLLSGWYGSRELVQVKLHVNVERLTHLFESFVRKGSRLTTSFHRIKPLAKGSDEVPPVITQTEEGIRLRGQQAFGADVLFADELLVLINHAEDNEPSGIAVIPLDSAGLEVQVYPDWQAGVTVRYQDLEIGQERILANGEAERVRQLLQQPAAAGLADYQWVARQLGVLELIAGTAFALAEDTGLNKELHIQTVLGEIVQHLEVLNAFINTAEAEAGPNEAGLFLPLAPPLQAARKAGGVYIHHALQALERVGQSVLNPQSFSVHQAHDREQEAVLRRVQALVGSGQAYRSRQHERYAFGDPVRQAGLFYQQYDFEPYRALYQKFWNQNGSQSKESS